MDYFDLLDRYNDRIDREMYLDEIADAPAADEDLARYLENCNE